MEWVLKEFDALTVRELYEIMRLRSEVFVVEQNCPYLDPDGKDQKSWHLMGVENGLLVAYTRLLPAGVSFDNVSIGRVATSQSVRGGGIGRLLMEKSIENVYALWGNVPIEIGAQLYLQKFYSSLGFVQSSAMYLEDGIEHIEMRKPAMA